MAHVIQVLMGRFLTTAEVQRLARTTNLDISANALYDRTAPADFAEVRSALAAKDTRPAQTLDADHVASYVLYPDPSGKSGVVLRVVSARDIKKEGRKALAAFGASLALIAVAILACFAWVPQRISRPLFRSTEALTAAAQDGAANPAGIAVS
jgi:hypothetical protein